MNFESVEFGTYDVLLLVAIIVIALAVFFSMSLTIEEGKNDNDH